MFKCSIQFFVLLAITLHFLSSSAYASETSPKPSETVEDDSVIKRAPEGSPQPPKIYSNAEIKKKCARYNGKYLSIYGDVFKIEKCTRRPIADSQVAFQLQRRGVVFIETDSADIAEIPEGAPLESSSPVQFKNCAALNGKFVTISYTDIYFVQKCKKQLVPDYETLVELSRTHKKSNLEVIAVSEAEFELLKMGEPLASVTSEKKNVTQPDSKSVDIIPIDEACKGLNGKIVSFYSKIYKVEKCRKIELDPEEFSKGLLRKNSAIVELTPEKWISLPTTEFVPKEEKKKSRK